MEDGQYREAGSEAHTSLPFNFRATRLQLTQEKTGSRKACPRHCGLLAGMEDGQYREAGLEVQQLLPFNVRAPHLQLTHDKSQSRISWQ